MPADGISVAPESTGPAMATYTFTEGGETRHRQRVTTESSRTRRGQYRAHPGLLSVQAAAHAATVGFWWLINPVGSTTAVAMQRVSFSSSTSAVTSMPSLPRITLETFTFTGTPSGATVTPAVSVRQAIGGGPADSATPIASLRTASTGLTLTAGAPFKAFLPVANYASTAFYAVPANDEWNPQEPDDQIILGPGDGIICRQADNGTTSDIRRFVTNVTWLEFTAP